MQYRYVGKLNVRLYNNYLSKYSLNTDVKLSEAQLLILENEIISKRK